MPAGLDPRNVAGFLTTPQPDLEIDGEAVTPIRWLTAGQPTGAVIYLARDLMLI